MSKSDVRLRVDEFDRLMDLRGWKTVAERCEALGISPAQYSKVRSGKSRDSGGSGPGGRFIHRCLTVLGVEYTALFTDEAEPERESVAS